MDMVRSRSIIVATVAVAVVLSLRAFAQGAFDVTRKPVTAEDLRDELGLDIYSFLLAVPEEDRFSFAVLTVSPDAQETIQRLGIPFSRRPGEPPAVRLSLLRASSLRGHALLSDDAWLDIRVTLTGCDGGGFATTIRNPAADIPRNEILLIPALKREGDRIHLVEVWRRPPGDTNRGKLAAAVVIVKDAAK
jgi:hypothetical protein